MKGESSTSSGIGFSGLLAIVFIALKLTGYIDWPWVWVLSPIWIGIVLIITVVGIFISIAIIMDRKI